MGTYQTLHIKYRIFSPLITKTLQSWWPQCQDSSTPSPGGAAEKAVPENTRSVFPGDSHQFNKFLSISIIFYPCLNKWILSIWELKNEKARCTWYIKHGEGVNCASTHTLLHQLPDPNPLLLCSCSFRPSARPVSSHTPTLSLANVLHHASQTHWHATLATQVFLNRKCFLYNSLLRGGISPKNHNLF